MKHQLVSRRGSRTGFWPHRRTLARLGLSLPVSLGLLAAARPAVAADWYVDVANGSDSFNGKSATHAAGSTGPWASIGKACSWATFAQAGDTVHVAPTGIYVSSARSGTVNCEHSGAPGNPITFHGEGVYPNLTKIQNDGTAYSVLIQGSYQTWTNFDIGTSAPVATLFATGNANHWDCVYSTPGGSLSAPAKAPLIHLSIVGNVIHGCGGNGVDLFNSDYLLVLRNIIYGNANTTTNAYDSGVTILGAADSDSNTGYKVVVDSNVIYNNSNIPNCAASNANCLNVVGDSDGNGIILDVNDLRYSTYSSGLYPMIYGPGYNGRILVQNNLVFGNGGRCIHAYRTKHVDILNNTCYRNFQDPYFAGGTAGEIDSSGGYAALLAAEPTLAGLPQYNGTPAMSGGDEHVFNNAIVANGTKAAQHTGAPASSCLVFVYTNQASTAQNNQCFLAAGSSAGALVQIGQLAGVVNAIDPSLTGALYIPPNFVSPGLDPTVANFHPAGGSMLLADAKNGLGPVLLDVTGAARSPTAMTIGAYEH